MIGQNQEVATVPVISMDDSAQPISSQHIEQSYFILDGNVMVIMII
jgi:hypothetical protein